MRSLLYCLDSLAFADRRQTPGGCSPDPRSLVSCPTTGQPRPPHLPWLGPSRTLSLCAQALLPFGFMLIQQVGAPLCPPGIATSCMHLPGLMSQCPVMINDLRPWKVVLVCLLSQQDAVSVAVRVVDLGARLPGFEPILLCLRLWPWGSTSLPPASVSSSVKST